MPAVRQRSANAAMAVWDWRRAGTPADKAPENRRRTGLLRATIGALIGAFFFWRGGVVLAVIAWSLSGSIGLLALLTPDRGYAAVDRALARLAKGVGLVIGWLVLVPVFYLIFFPFRLIARRGAADAMQRRLDPSAPTYWRQRPAEEPSLERPF